VKTPAKAAVPTVCGFAVFGYVAGQVSRVKRMAVLAAAACGTIGCGPRAVSPDMTACVPAGTIALAGMDLDRIRAAPRYARLPAAALAPLEAYRSAHRLLAAWSGTNLMIVLRGTAAGAAAMAKDIEVIGPEDAIRAARAQYQSGKSGAPGLVDAAKTVASSQVWAVAKGGIALPVEGNARNLNRLFRGLEYAALAMDLDSGVDVRVIAVGRTEQGARDFEQSLRALLSLAAAAESRNAEVEKLLGSAQVERSGVKATARLQVGTDAIDPLLKLFGR